MVSNEDKTKGENSSEFKFDNLEDIKFQKDEDEVEFEFDNVKGFFEEDDSKTKSTLYKLKE